MILRSEASRQLCFNSKATTEQVTCLTTLYILAITIFFATLILFLQMNKSNIVLRERSCNILIIQCFATYGYLIIYPITILVSDQYDEISYKAIIFFIAQFKYIPILCYLFRACRFLYAFHKPWRWLVFQGIYLLLILLTLSTGIGILSVYTEFEKNIFYENLEEREFFVLRMLSVYISQIIFLISLFCVRKVNMFQNFDYILAFILEALAFGVKAYMKNGYGFEDCSDAHKIPIYYYIDCLKGVLILICSTIAPLFFQHKSVSDFPFEMQCSNFYFFINQPQFVAVFYKFIKYLDKQKIVDSFSGFQHQINSLGINNTTTLFEDQQLQTIQYSFEKCFLDFIQLSLLFSDDQQTESNIFNELKLFFSNINKEDSQLHLIVSEKVMHQLQQELNSSYSQISMASEPCSEKSLDIKSLNLIEIGWYIKDVLSDILRNCFENYFKRTVSYRTLYMKCEENKQIWIRLGKIGLTCAIN